MDVQAVSALLAALLILAIGTSVLLRSRSDRMYTAFAAFTFTVSAWHLCSFIAAATSSPLMSGSPMSRTTHSIPGASSAISSPVWPSVASSTT